MKRAEIEDVEFPAETEKQKPPTPPPPPKIIIAPPKEIVIPSAAVDAQGLEHAGDE
jgi:hypothetical protein